MSNTSKSLTKWFSERHQWFQIATRRLYEQGKITDKDIAENTILCKQEANGNLPEKKWSFPASAFFQSTSGTLRLCSISDVEGINALAPKNPLVFGKGNLTVVYGSNGSGKSGYVRLLKHVCGARQPGVLYSDIFKPDPLVKKACISYEQDNSPKSHLWTGQCACIDLNSVDIYDASFSSIFVTKEDEVRYEPPILSFLSALIDLCEKVAASLEKEAQMHQSKKPRIPDDNKLTVEGIWYESISHETTSSDIDKNCSFVSDDELEMQMLQQRFSEKAPAERANQLRKQKDHIENLVQDAKKFRKQLSRSNCRRIIVAKKKSIQKKKTADTFAQTLFKGSRLEGIGSEVWKELWEAARSYSLSFAYKETEYPNVSGGSRCVLCHQILTREAKVRLTSFDDFVKGGLQRALQDAAEKYETAKKTIEELPTQEVLKTTIDAAGVVPEKLATQVIHYFSRLKARKDQLLLTDLEETDLVSLPSQRWIGETNLLSKSLGEMAEKYESDANSDKKQEIQERLESLKARKWLSEQRISIDSEVSRMKLIDQIQRAKILTDTTILSKKKGELAEVMISDAFVRRFNKELELLKASHLKVELTKTKVSKGRVLHKLQLKGPKKTSLIDILSEGESRVVSIAAFLADVAEKDYKAPFIFDDPISSLDQTYEEAVVKRLVDLSQDKQVIVFSHRLSLLGLIHEYSKKADQEPHIICIQAESWGAGEPGDAPLYAKRTDKALNSLINDRLSKAKRLFLENGVTEYRPYAQGLCSDFRILLERIIEFDLMADVVSRFRREVQTKNKINKLALINRQDCKFMDELMTKYSRYEHSQSLETPVSLPEPEEFEKDFKKLKAWKTEFSKRAGKEEQTIQ